MDDRLDRVVCYKFQLTRSQAQKLIKQNSILVDGKIINNPKVKVSLSSILELKEDKKFISGSKKLNIEVIYENEDFLCINKPSGLAVQDGPGIEYSLSTYLSDNRSSLKDIGGLQRYGLVHRLDKDTTGALLIAKNQESFKQLTLLFKERRIHKTYFALVHGKLDKELKLEFPLGRNPKNRMKRSVLRNGKESITFLKPIALIDNKFTLIKAKPRTGRMHQIRVHLKYINRPIVGDRIYGKDNQKHFFLHSASVRFHFKGILYNLSAKFPEYWKDYLKYL